MKEQKPQAEKGSYLLIKRGEGRKTEMKDHLTPEK